MCNIKNINIDSKSIVLQFKEQKKPDMRVFTLKNPDRLVIDIKNCTWLSKDPVLPTKGIVSSFKHAKKSDNVYRLVFGMNGSSSIDAGYRGDKLTLKFLNFKPTLPAKLSKDDNTKSEKIVKQEKTEKIIQSVNNTVKDNKTIAPAALTTKKETKKTPPALENATIDQLLEKNDDNKKSPAIINDKNEKAEIIPEKIEEKPVVATTMKKGNSDKIVIVLDPGHGGKDPGANGPRGTLEKNVVLKTALELREALEATGNYKVVMTRSNDTYVPLRGRIDIARGSNADLFISLHADSAVNSTASGMSVYTLSERASDKEAEKLARKENQSDIIAGVDLSHESSDVSNILIDLVQRGTMNASAEYATRLVGALSSSIKLKYESHRFAGFVVLKAPDVPSVLIEMGYLSNPKEEWLLVQKSHREKLVNGIVKATQSYFQDFPAASKRVSWQK